VTEKIFNGLLANSVPIYFGAPDVTDYVNIDAVVVCDIAPAKVRYQRRRSV
jgi:hypothetical protein